MKRRWVLAASLAAVATSASAATPAPVPAGIIRWVVQDMPPHFNFPHGRPPRSVAELGRGEVEGFLKLLLARMDGWQHEFIEAGTARYEAESRRGRTLCSAMHVRTPERLQWAWFSHLYPALASREIHVVVRRELLERLVPGRVEDGRLPLAELLQRPELRLIVARDRAFGPQVDALLAQHTVARVPVGAKVGAQLLDMLRAGRMDYTLEYPTVVSDYLARQGDADALVSLPMAEGQSTALATVSCSRTAEGRRALEAIDAAVRELARDPRREAWVRAWRGDRTTPQDWKRLNAYMDERARGGPRIE